MTTLTHTGPSAAPVMTVASKPAAFIMWLLVLPSSFLAAFVFHLSPLAVFICLKSDQILKCAVAAYKVNRYTWIKVISRDV